MTINRLDRIADLNLDEIPDLIGRGFSLEGFIVHLGRIGGGYSPAAYFGYEAPANFYTGLELADVDGDGDIEVVTLSSHQQAVRVHDNRRN